jgi:protein TonB
MGSIFRLLLGVPLAVIVVGGLFLLMYGLIKVDEIQLEEERDPVQIQIGRQIEDAQLVNQKRFERPALDQPPPPPPAIDRANFEPTVDGVAAAAPDFGTDVDIGSAFNPDREAQPLVRVPPSGFERCFDSNTVQESVSLEFNVTPTGQVVNVEVIDSTDSCYNRYAVRSAEKWKYQPKIVDGEPQWRYGVRTVIRFQAAAE